MTKILSNKSNIDLDYPICRPSLDLDFTQEVLDPRITFSRGSIGTRVNRNRLIETVSTNLPRFDFDPVTGECRGLLIEESRSNLVAYSDAITTSNLYGFSNSTLTQVTTTTPISGLTLATKVFLNVGANAGNSQNGFNFGTFSLTNSTVYTQSIFVKASGSSVFRLRSNVTGQVFDIPIAGPAPTLTGTITSCTVTPYPDGWSRISWTFTSTTSTPGNRGDHWAMKPNVADGSSGFLVTGAQLEAGAFPTSYIPTTASTVTRSADNAQMTGTNFSSWFNSTEGSIYCSVNFIENLSSSNFASNNILYGINDNSTNNRITLFGLNGNKSIVSRYVISGFTYPSSTVVISSRQNKFAHSFKTTGISLVGNGGTPSTSQTVTSTYPIVNRLEIGNQIGTFYLNGTISRLTYYPRALKPNQLQYLTQ